MSFFRPEALAALHRFREVLAGGGLVVLGTWWVVGLGGLLGYIGPFVIAAGGALGWTGWQRARFRAPGKGPGWVRVDEGEIIYMGPLDGGSVALADLSRLTLDGAQTPAHWRLDRPGRPPLMIPVNAEGADSLFDAFAHLPGLRTDRMLAELEADPSRPVVIWKRRPWSDAHSRLH